MATKRTSMRNVREILRMKWLLHRSHRDIAKSLGISAGLVGSVLARAKAKGLSWAALKAFQDDQLEQLLYGPRGVKGTARPEPDCAHLHTELRRPGVTLELLHVEYLEDHPDGFRYSAFCARYKQWKKRQRRSMRQVHKAGEKAFVDYSGKKLQIVDPKTGEVSQVELFVAVLGASNLSYAEASLTQKSRDWIASNTRALEYFGGVPDVIVPDQLKSGVTRSCRYEPGIHRTYEDWSKHTGTVIIPARPRKPKDKAKVEVAVQIVQRWILAKIRNETFFSLEALNDRIAELLEELNNRPMRSYGGLGRLQLFEKLERAALKPLPAERFVYVDWLEARVNIDYHIEVDKHFYSVPHTLIHQLLDVRLSATTVDVLLNGDRVWLHRRSYLPGRHTTVPEHMPKAHQAHLEWSPSRLIHWGGTVGPQTAKLIKQIMQSRPHPEQGYRSCLGLMRLSKHYGSERFEAAAARAIAVGATSYRHVESILKHGLDRLPVEPVSNETKEPIDHDNLRGADYYKSQGDE